MKVIGVNNMEPGNQGVTIYFDGMDTEHIADALTLLYADMANRTYPKIDDADQVPDVEFRDFLRKQVAQLQSEFVYLNEYLDSINPNVNGDSDA